MSKQHSHIQDFGNASSIEPHWGYAGRTRPCTSDSGTCEYLDAVYWMHDVSMLYTFVLWAVLAGVAVFWVVLRFIRPRRQSRSVRSEQEAQKVWSHQNRSHRLWRGLHCLCRRHLLPECPTSVFGNVTRVQVLILAVLLGYLLVFSLVGIVYKTWITPVKDSTLYNTRTGIGGLADRVGAFAYALTPLTVLLSTRQSVLSLVTGVPHQNFLFLHRWTGRIIYVQSALHTLGWTLVEAEFYQPQPQVYRAFISQDYMIWGCVAMLFISFLFVFSFRRVIELTGYEFFKKSHHLVAALFIGACWGHWDRLSCWMIASFGVMVIDLSLQALSFGVNHICYRTLGKGLGVRPAAAKLQVIGRGDDIVVRVDFDHGHKPWRAGSHFYLCFPELSIWQSHPFTVASVAEESSENPHHHTYIIRCRKGQTATLAKLADRKAGVTTPVILTGPYGAPRLAPASNVLAVAGGTGISFALPIVMATATAAASGTDGVRRDRLVRLVWSIRSSRDLAWVAPELRALKALASRQGPRVELCVFVTREREAETGHGAIEVAGLGKGVGDEKSRTEDKIVGIATTASESGSELEVEDLLAPCPGVLFEWLGGRHPDLSAVLADYLAACPSGDGMVQVMGSGPAGMGRDLRMAVAASNHAGNVVGGNERSDVSLRWDSREG